jgi:DNA-binding helix-hairpin-helix protein with protein kinase domain
LLTLPLLAAMAVGGVIAPPAAGGLLLLAIIAFQLALAGSYVTSQAFRRKAALQIRIKWLLRQRRRLRATLDYLAARQGRLQAQRKAALAQALKEHQTRCLEQELARYVLFIAPIPGIGLVLRARLYAAGYRTAADIGPQIRRTPGIGPARANALLKWRQRCEAHASRYLPQSLPPDQAAAIHRRWDRKLHRVQQARSKTFSAYQDNRQALADAEREAQTYLDVTLRNYLGQVLSL